MDLLDSIRRALGQREQQPPVVHQTAEPKEVTVPEITAADLRAERQKKTFPLLLDCREDHEWRQGAYPRQPCTSRCARSPNAWAKSRERRESS